MDGGVSKARYMCRLQTDSIGRGNDMKDVLAMQKGLS